MKRKEEAMKKYIASFLAICMIFVMVPILPAEAAGLEDTERVEILELVESYMDSRETSSHDRGHGKLENSGCQRHRER